MSACAVYRILDRDQWEAARATGAFAGSADDARDGFIHLSARDQVAGTLAKHYAHLDIDGLLALEIDAGALGEALKWEPSRGGALFPHLYAPLPVSAVRAVRPARALADPSP